MRITAWVVLSVAVACTGFHLRSGEPAVPPTVAPEPECGVTSDEQELLQELSLPNSAPKAKLEVAYDESETAKRFFEGPSYDPKTDTLYFTAFAQDGSQILKLDAAGKVGVFMDKTAGINGTFLSRRGGLLGCQGEKQRVVRISLGADAAGEPQVLADGYDGKKFIRPNDIAEDARGGFYFTDPDFDHKKSSAVYYVSPEGQIRVAVNDMQVPNGVYVAKGGKMLYVSDSGALHIRAYPVNPVTGEVDQQKGRVFFEAPSENKNAPDGMTMDEHGNMYFTGRGGIWVADPAGRLLGLIPIPEFCSNCTFGGRDGRTLYMTCQNRVYRLAMNVRGWEFASRHELAGNEPLKFKKIVLDTTFRSEGVAVADVNRDGKMDVLAGEVWYEAPSSGSSSWKMHEIRPPGRYDGSKGYSQSFGCFAEDLNGDGYPDLIVIPFPGAAAHWYENSAGKYEDSDGKPIHWKEHVIWHSACNETPLYTDLLGTGKRQLVMGWQPEGKENEGIMAYFTPAKAAADKWEQHSISGPKAPGTFRFSHGLGVGDVNGDGRNDVIITEGWWEQAADRSATEWTFHRAPFGPACADMYAYDVNGDGLSDVISSSAHDYGIWWFEQIRSASGEVQWKQHLIDDSFSQSHALHLVDMNGDSVKDLVTGKRYFAHQGHDAGEFEPIVLYWYELKRQKGQPPQFIPHLIDLGVGIATQFVVTDINGDKRPDIVVSNKRGVHILEQVGGGK